MKNIFFRAASLLILVLAMLLPLAGGSAPYHRVTPLGEAVAEDAFPATTIRHRPAPVIQLTVHLSSSPELLTSETTEEQKEERSPSAAAITATAFSLSAGCGSLTSLFDLSSSWAVPKRYLLYHALRIAC